MEASEEGGARSPAKRTRARAKPGDRREGNGRPLEEGIERPPCKRAVEAGEDHGPMRSYGKPTERYKPWKCATCGYRYNQPLQPPQKPGNKPGKRLSLPGKRRIDDRKGKRIDRLTTTLERIVESPTRSNEREEAILDGATVLQEIRDDPF